MRIKPFLKSSFLLSLSTVYFLLSTVSVARAVTPEELQFAIEQKARKLEEVSKQLEQTQLQLTDITVQGKTLSSEVNKINQSVKSVDLGIQQSQLTVEKLGLQVQSIQSNIFSNEEAVALRQEALTQFIREFQRKSSEDVLLVMLSNKTLSESLASVQQISDLSAGILQEVDQIRRLKGELSKQLSEVNQKKQAVLSEKEILAARKAIAQEQLAERQRLLAEVKNKEKNYQELVAELQEQQQSISDEISQVEETMRDKFGTSALPRKRPGVFIEPVDESRMTQGYGKTKDACRLYKKTCFHNGVDYGIPIGTPIYAADDGVVFAAGNNGKLQYGRYIVIKHDNLLATLYAHLSKQTVKAGETVKRGQLIGYSGKTGYAFGPHLHFGVYLASTVQLKTIAGAGPVPVGYVLDPTDYLP